MRESQEDRLRYSGGSYCMSEAWPVYKSGRLVLAWRGLMASGGSFPRGVESNQCLVFFQRSPECILYALKCQILSYLKSYKLRSPIGIFLSNVNGGGGSNPPLSS